MSQKKKAPPRRKPNVMHFVRPLLRCGIMIAIALGSAEVAVRALGWWVAADPAGRNYFAMSDREGVPYLLRPNLDTSWAGKQILTDAAGLRSSRKLEREHDGIFRIAVIGDETIFGNGVEQSQTIPRHLEDLLNERAAKKGYASFEVLNAGIEGFGASEQSALLRYVIEEYRPEAIAWYLDKDDWDDAPVATPEGRLSEDHPRYAASSEWTRRWSKGREGASQGCIHIENLLLDMDESSRALAKGEPAPPAVSLSPYAGLDRALSRSSFLYALLRHKWRASAGQPPHPGSKDCLPLREESGVEGFPLLPAFSSLGFSPTYNRRFREAVAHGAAYASERGIPILILLPDAGRDLLSSVERGKIYVDDLPSYLGEDFESYEVKHSLGWHEALGPQGNEEVARAIYSSLVLRGIVQASEAIQPLSRDDFLARLGSWREETAKKYVFESIDLEKFKHLHQLAGGLGPARDWPELKDRPANFIIKNSRGGSIAIRGENSQARTQKLEVAAADSRASYPRTLAVPRGAFDLRIPLATELRASREHVLDLKISCAEKECGGIKLDYLAIE